MKNDESQMLRVGVAQMNSQPDPSESLDQMITLITEAAERGAECILLPENFIHYGNEGQKWRKAAKLQALVEKTLPELSRENGVWILGGGYPVVAESNNGERYPKIYNRAVLWDPNGELRSHYDKIHLFDVDVEGDQQYQESRYVMPGDPQSVTFDLNEQFTLGLSICYDLRFPELYRDQVTRGANVLCVPAAFTYKTGCAHWHALVRARAIENTSYVLAAAQYGSHGESMRTFGHAMIVDPWGEVIAEAKDDKPTVLIADLNPSLIAKIRRNLPSLKHRRISKMQNYTS